VAKIAGRTRDSAREVQVEQEMLAERLSCGQTVLANDLGKRRQTVGGGRTRLLQVVDRRQARMSITATRRKSRR
jgi:hypothetical protein